MPDLSLPPPRHCSYRPPGLTLAALPPQRLPSEAVSVGKLQGPDPGEAVRPEEPEGGAAFDLCTGAAWSATTTWDAGVTRQRDSRFMLRPAGVCMKQIRSRSATDLDTVGYC